MKGIATVLHKRLGGRKIIPGILAVAVLLAASILWPVIAQADEIYIKLDTYGGNLTIPNTGLVDDDYFITLENSASTSNRIIVESGYTGAITLTDVVISAGLPPVEIQAGANPTIIIDGDVRLTGTGTNAGMFVDAGASVHIDSANRNDPEPDNTANILTAQGGSGAGIGGNRGTGTGNISIANITVTATGTQGGAAGIGGGGQSDANVGSITITNCVTTATSGAGSNNNTTTAGGAAIGGGGSSSSGTGRTVGDITIRGGSLKAVGGDYGMGIGGGSYRSVGKILIQDCDIVDIQATSNSRGAGIGAGYGINGIRQTAGDIILKNNKKVIVNTSGNGAGIGGGPYSSAKSITLEDNGSVEVTAAGGAGIGGSGYGTVLEDIIIQNNGPVTAQGTYAAIGGGNGSASIRVDMGSITIQNNGDITADGGIGGYLYGDVDEILIRDNGSVTATGVNNAAIGGGQNSAVGSITITGNGDISATTTRGGAGVGGGLSSTGVGSITIDGGGSKLTATAGEYGAAGIGGGGIGTGSVGDITLTNCAIEAASGSYYPSGNYANSWGAAIGGGGAGSTTTGQTAGKITITGGSVKATGGDTRSVGIGAGSYGSVGDILIQGCASVEATSEGYGSGIGASNGTNGYRAIAGNITLEDNGPILATAASNGAGIGAGQYSTVGDITITGTNGDIEANASGSSTAGIGGAMYSSIGDITIRDNDGDVLATGAPAIGGGSGNSTNRSYAKGIYIENNGDITATGGISSISYCDITEIELKDNGSITATGVHYAAIGSGQYSSVGSITITGNRSGISAITTGGGAGIGGGMYSTGVGNITVDGGGHKLTATGAANGTAAIGGGGRTDSDVGDITLLNCVTVATGGTGASNINGAAIGGGGSSGIGTGHKVGNITIRGGSVTAVGGNLGMGIGAGSYKSMGDILIEDCEIVDVTATSSSQGAGIGAGFAAAAYPQSTGDITLRNNGQVTVDTSGNGAGIGASRYASVKSITLEQNDSVDVKATTGAGIGGAANSKVLGDITLQDNGPVSAQGNHTAIGGGSGDASATTDVGGIYLLRNGSIQATGGIGGFYYGDVKEILVEDNGPVTATGNHNAAIGSGQTGAVGNISITGNKGDISATTTGGGAGIGGGVFSTGVGSITVEGEGYQLTAKAGTYGAAAIGGGGYSNSSVGDITLTGCVIEATGADYYPSNAGTVYYTYSWGAAIGGGGGNTTNGQEVGKITITGGSVKATGGATRSVGIGAGSYGSVGDILIQGCDFVEASSDGYGTGIGTAYTSNANRKTGGDIILKDNGSILATAGSNGGAAIGAGTYTTVGDITITGTKGDIEATSSGGAGIGGGATAGVKNITITGNAGDVRATGTIGGIGGGSGATASRVDMGKIIIQDNGDITADGGIGSYSFGDVDEILIQDNGSVTATGVNNAAIGGGQLSSVGDITITGNGDISATTTRGGAGVGGGQSGTGVGSITIDGGGHQLTAKAGDYGAAGIGGGGIGTGTVGDITLTNCAIEAASGSYYPSGNYANSWGAAIGGGGAGSTTTGQTAGKITITGGSVKATGGGERSVGIGGGSYGSVGDILIQGCDFVEASGATYGAGIGASNGTNGYRSVVGNITLTDNGPILATATGNYGAGIGASQYSTVGDITITGTRGKIEATGSASAGIGGSSYSEIGDITIRDNDGDVLATGIIGIGGGAGNSSNRSLAKNITIENNGDISATGGIGSYSFCNVDTILIRNNGAVTATAGNVNAAIGGGQLSSVGDILLIGNTSVSATAGGTGSGIGNGQGSIGLGLINISGGSLDVSGGTFGVGGSFTSPGIFILPDVEVLELSGGTRGIGYADQIYYLGAVQTTAGTTPSVNITTPAFTARTRDWRDNADVNADLSPFEPIISQELLDAEFGGDPDGLEKYFIDYTSGDDKVDAALDGLYYYATQDVEYSTDLKADNGASYLPDTILVADITSGGQVEAIFDFPRWEMDPYEDPYDPDDDTAQPIEELDLGAVTYGDATFTSRTFVLVNTGNRELVGFDFTINMEDGAPDSFAIAGLPTTMDGGDTATITVTPKAGLDAGSYEGTLIITANGVGEDSGQVADAAIRVLLEVEKASATDDELKADIDDGAFTNREDIGLEVITGHQLETLWYLFTKDPNPPGNDPSDFDDGSFAGPGLTSTEELPEDDDIWYLHWYIETNNTLGYGGWIGPYHIDRVSPTASIGPDPYPGTVNGTFPVTVDFADSTGTVQSGFEGTETLDPGDITVKYGEVTSVVGSGSTFTVTVKPEENLAADTGIEITVEEGAVHDRAGNPNTASDTLLVTFNDSIPSADISGFNDKVYPEAQSQFTFSVSSGYSTDTLYLLDGDGVTLVPITDANAADVLAVELDDAPFSAYTVEYDDTTNTFTVKANTSFGEGLYKVAIEGIVNGGHNPMEPTPGQFQVCIPRVVSIEANPDSHGYEGGETVFTVKTENVAVNLDAKNDVALWVARDDINLNATMVDLGGNEGDEYSGYTITLTVPVNGLAEPARYWNTEIHDYIAFLEVNKQKIDVSPTPPANQVTQVTVGEWPLLQLTAQTTPASDPVTVDLGSYTYGDVVTNSGSFVLTNAGNRTLDGFAQTIAMDGGAPVAFSVSGLPAGELDSLDDVTVTVVPVSGLNAGTYEGTLTIRAKGTGEESGKETEADVRLKLVVDKAATPLDGDLDTTPSPKLTDVYTNAPTIEMTANPGSGNTLEQVDYTFEPNPGPGTALSGSFGPGTTHTAKLPDDDGPYRLEWDMTTNNTAGSGIPLDTYHIDRVAPTAAIDPYSGTVSRAFPITVRVQDTGGAYNTGLEPGFSLSATDITVLSNNASVTGITDQGSFYEVEITPGSGLVTGEAITVQVNGGIVKDLAGNPNTASGILEVTYNDSAPQVLFGSFNGAVYPVDQSTIDFAVDSNYGTTDLFLSDGSTPITDANAKGVFELTHNGSIVTSHTVTVSGNTFTVSGLSGLGEGKYQITVKEGEIVNGGGNGLAEDAVGSFQVLYPTAEEITPATQTLPYDGGPVTLTIKGKNLLVHDGNPDVTVGVRKDGESATESASYSHSSGGYDYCTVQVEVPGNASDTVYGSHTYTVYLNDSTGEQKVTPELESVIKVERYPKYDFSVTPSSHIFPNLTYGYADSQADGIALTVNIKNTGNQDLYLNTPILSGSGFQMSGLSQNPVPEGATATLTVTPAYNLNAGGYAGTLSLTARDVPDGEQPKEVDLDLTVTKGAGSGGTVTTPLADSTPTNVSTARLDISLEEPGTLEGAHYLISASPTYTGGIGGMQPFVSGQSVTFDPPDADYYIHWILETKNYADTQGRLGPFEIDRSAPTVTLTPPTDPTVNGSFQVQVDIEDSSGTNDKGFASPVTANIQVSGGTASATMSFSGGGNGPLTANINVQPTINGAGTITVTVSGVRDRAGNEAGVKNIDVKFDNRRPGVSFEGLPSGVSASPLQSFRIVTTEQLYNSSSAAVTDADIQGVLTITNTDTNTIVSPTVTLIDAETFQVAGPFGEGAYTVEVVGNTLKNANNNLLVGNDAAFTVRIPEIQGISIQPSPAAFGYNGGTATVRVTGKNFQYADIALSQSYTTGGAPGAIRTLSTSNTLVEYQVDLPRNYIDALLTYTFTAALTNQQTGVVDTYGTTVQATVAAATPSVTGLEADPDWMNYEAGPTTLTVTGVNLHNYSNLRLEEQSTGNIYYISGLANGATEAVCTVPLPANTTLTDKVYTFRLAADSPAITGVPDAVVTVEAANPVLGDGSSSALTADPDWFDRDGGTTTLTIRGENLHNFDTFEIHDNDRGAVHLIDPAYISSDYRTASIQVALPVNPNLDDEEYLFELYTGVSLATPPVADGYTGDDATVTVEGSKPKVTSVSANPNRLTSEGGSSTFTIEGKYLENAFPLELWDSLGGSYTVTDIAPDGESAAVTITFPGNLGPRNDIHQLEAYIAGEATGVSGTVEVGDSNPYVDGAYATPETLAVSETLNSAGKSVITVTGGYLYGFDSIRLYDEMNDIWYNVTAREPEDDMEASCTVSIPSNEGAYTFQVWANGEYTGCDAHVYVGVEPGHVNPEGDENEVPRNPDDKEWAGRGGGHKGQGFTGDYGGFDFLFHHAKQAVLQDGENAAVTLQNVWFIAKSQLDYASSGAREADWRNGRIRLQFDTTLPGSGSMLEGRLILDPFQVKYSVYPTICTCEDETEHTRRLFRERYENLAVVRLMQEGSFGAEVEVLANVDLSGMDTDNLHFYRYDRATGEFTRIQNPEYSVDSSGFLRFFTTEGGDYVVTGAPLTEGGAAVAAGQLRPDAAPDRKDGDAEDDGEE